MCNRHNKQTHNVRLDATLYRIYLSSYVRRISIPTLSLQCPQTDCQPYILQKKTKVETSARPKRRLVRYKVRCSWKRGKHSNLPKTLMWARPKRFSCLFWSSAEGEPFSPAWQQLGGCSGPKGGKKGDLELIRACNNLFRGGEKSCAFSSETVMLEKTFRGYT